MPFTFGFPPYASDTVMRTEEVKNTLSRCGFTNFRVSPTYGDLIRDLLAGRCQAAWATPVVCAHVEGAGGKVLLRATRQGAGAYRSVLFARKDRRVSTEALKGLVAAWPDAQSMSGYILPRTMMAAMGHPPAATLHRENLLGSTRACVEAVLDRRADVSATDASAASATPQVNGFEALAGPRASELTALAWSPDCPHGGIILSPVAPEHTANKITQALAAVREQPEAVAQVARALGVDAFEVPAPDTYAPLREFLTAPTKKLHVKLA
jgi:ABC-type phosphate/phosphonate transport system substrate-binding protein